MKRSLLATLPLAAITTAAALMVPLPAQANQPKMKAALVNLNEAKENLEEANTGKGGHRGKAIELIEEAIEQVEKGIKAGRM